MNSKLNEKKEFQLKIIYKHKNNIIKKISLDIYKIIFDDILDYFSNVIKKEYPQFILKSKYFFKGKDIAGSDKILNLILINHNVNIETLIEINLEIYLDQIYSIIDEDIPNYPKLIIPNKTNDSFEIYIFFPNKGIIYIEEYLQNKYNQNILNKINSKTSFCNSIDYLFLSGGEYNNEIIDDFWIIDNKAYSVKNLKLPSSKINHSMLPLNNNNVLIIGGNDSKVYLYNIEKNEFITLEDTNKIHINPTLFLWKNYIYCFSKQDKLIIAEKMLYSKDEQHKWEIINLNFINNNETSNINNIENNNSSNENILIFLGENNCIVYNPLNNSVEYVNNNILNCDFNICLNDKNIYKINKYYNVFIPNNFEKEKKLFVLNKKYRKIHKMKFLPSKKDPKIKYQYQEREIFSEENNIKIEINDSLDNKMSSNEKILNFENYNEKININEKNDEDINFKMLKLKKVMKIIKPEDKKDGINTNEEILINEVFDQKEINEDKNIKLNKKNSNLIVPKDIVYEQLIERESDKSENENNIDTENDIDRDIDEKELKIIPKKHNLNTNLKDNENNNDINNEINENENTIFEEINIKKDIENKNEIINKKIKEPKPNIHLLISEDNIDNQLFDREIKNKLTENNDKSLDVNNNNNDKNDNILVEIKNKVITKLKNMDLKIDDNSNSDEVFNYESMIIDGEQNKKEDELRKSNTKSNKPNLLISKESLDEQLINRNIDLKSKNDENNNINKEN